MIYAILAAIGATVLTLGVIAADKSFKAEDYSFGAMKISLTIFICGLLSGIGLYANARDSVYLKKVTTEQTIGEYVFVAPDTEIAAIWIMAGSVIGMFSVMICLLFALLNSLDEISGEKRPMMAAQ